MALHLNRAPRTWAPPPLIPPAPPPPFHHCLPTCPSEDAGTVTNNAHTLSGVNTDKTHLPYTQFCLVKNDFDGSFVSFKSVYNF